MVYLCNRANHICFHPVVCYGRPALQMQIIADADINIFLPCGFFPSIFFSSPNLSGRGLDVYYTSAHGVAWCSG